MSTKNEIKNGIVTIKGGYVTLRYERRLRHPIEVVWKAITDPNELAVWFNAKAKIDAHPGGTIDYVNTASGFHTTGRITVWDPPRAFGHEWHIAPNPQLPNGEPKGAIRWSLERDGDFTILTATFTGLTKPTGLRFAPGTHAYLDRLEAHLEHAALPDWAERTAAVRGLYLAQ